MKCLESEYCTHKRNCSNWKSAEEFLYFPEPVGNKQRLKNEGEGMRGIALPHEH